MDFTLDADQELLVDTARSLLATECPPSLVRAHMDDPSVAEGLWKSLSQWTALAGQPLVDLCLFLEETGAVLAPGPFWCSTALFAPLLAATGNELLPSVLNGELTGTVAVAGRDGSWIANDEPTKCFVPEAQRVDVVAAASLPGPTITLYRNPEAHTVQTLDPSRQLAQVDLTASIPSGPGVRLDPGALEGLVERAAVSLAAEMMGTTRWIFEATLAYAKVREQFGRPIGSFQAVKHKLANMALARDQAWSAVYYAAMAIDAGDPDRHKAAHVAKAMAGEAIRLNLKDGMQIHGGIGYTYEHDLHLYVRRAIGSENLLGTTDWHRDRLADLML